MAIALGELLSLTPYTGNITITNNDYTVAELKAINNATTGTITLNNPDVALSGASADLALAFAGTITEHTGIVTITNPDYTVAELKTINAATSGSIVLSSTNTTLIGSSADLTLALAGVSLQATQEM